jgi:arsenate reductase-like glutaredoxin family protein
MNVSLSDLGNDDVIELMQQNPRIIVRPLLTDGRQILMRFDQQQYQEFVLPE